MWCKKLDNLKAFIGAIFVLHSFWLCSNDSYFTDVAVQQAFREADAGMPAIPQGGNTELTLDVDDTTRATYCVLAHDGPLREHLEVFLVVQTTLKGTG